MQNWEPGNWKGVLELNWHWMLGTWRPQRGIVSGCLVFCHFFVKKFVIRKCRRRRGDKYQVRILGTWKVRTVRWQRHLFVCRFSLILVYNLGSKHLILFDPNISNFFRCEWCVDSVTYYPTLTRYTGSHPASSPQKYNRRKLMWSPGLFQDSLNNCGRC